jgi:hypothetical protein
MSDYEEETTRFCDIPNCKRVSFIWCPVSKKYLCEDHVDFMPPQININNNNNTNNINMNSNNTTAINNFFLPKQPQKHSLADDRVINSTRFGKKRKTNHGKFDLSKDFTSKRISDFPGHYLKEDPPGSGALYCDCCHISVSNKKNTCDTHIKSQNHLTKKKKQDDNNMKEKVISEFLILQQEDKRINGDTMDMSVRVKRMAVTKTFMMSGIPFNKLEDEISGLKELVEAGSVKLSVRHLRDLIPQIQELELSLIRKEIKNVKYFSIIFDGTTDVCEVANIVLRWFDDVKVNIEQRLIACKLLVKSMNGEQLSAFIVERVFVFFQIPFGALHAACRDGAAVNGKAIRLIKQMTCPQMEDIICCSHSGALASNNFDCSLAKKFVSYWSYLVTTSNVAKQLFREELGRNPQRKSKVRWCAEFDVSREIAVSYPIVKQIIMREVFFSAPIRLFVKSYIILNINIGFRIR